MGFQSVKMGYRGLLLSIFLLLLPSCSVDELIQTPTASSTAPVFDSVSLTSTESASSNLTQTEISLTSTPAPALPVEVAETRVLELLTSNAGCALPCWWGITPGRSTSDQARSILEPLRSTAASEVRYGFGEDSGLLLMRPQPNGLRVGIQYLANGKIISMLYANTAMTKDVYDLVFDDPLYRTLMSAYTLDALLTKHGKPDQILIRSFSKLTAEFNPSQILLYYPEEGIVAQYFAQNIFRQERDEIVNWICPASNHIAFRLYDPTTPMSLGDLLAIDDSFTRYRQLAEATNMDIEAFFRSFKEYDEGTSKSHCAAYLKTSWELWPGQYRNP